MTAAALLAPPRPATYTFVTDVARGGMGYVELCFRREGRFWRWCVRKRLHEAFRSDVQFRWMFMDEARLAGLIRHPNVVGVSDVGEDDQGPFLIMDYVEGVSLARVIRDVGHGTPSIPAQVAIRICREVASGLHAAHEVRSEDGTLLSLVHRDVSPQNILIGFDGSVRVTDFGIAKALGNVSQTSVGVLKGNMGYLSPEQLRFEDPDRRSDFFSLGVSLYELLSGSRLYSNKEGFDGTRRILFEPPPDIGEDRSDIPPELVELLFEMLAKERDARPATAVEIGRRLDAMLAPLVKEEGAVTIADFMDLHFAMERQRHQLQLAQHLKRVDDAAATSVSSVSESVSGPLPSSSQKARPLRWAWLLVAVAPALLGLWLHQRGNVGSGSVSTASVSPPVAPVIAVVSQIAPALPPIHEPVRGANIALTATRTDVAQPTFRNVPRPSARANRRESERRSARGAERALAASKEKRTNRAMGGPGDLTVPLFTKWR